MRPIQFQAVQQAARFIESVGCTFKIITPDGQEFGTLEVTASTKRKRSSSEDKGRKHGDLRNYAKGYMNYDLPVGDVVIIPAGPYSLEDLRSTVCAELSSRWGLKSYTSSTKSGSLEILRIK